MDVLSINREIIIETEQNQKDDVVDKVLEKIRDYSRFRNYQRPLCYM